MAVRRSLFQLDLAFFGLTSEVIPHLRASLFHQIHEIVFHGQGGYDWDTVYNMPVWLRKYTFNKMKEYYDKHLEGVKRRYHKKHEGTTRKYRKRGENITEQLKSMKKLLEESVNS